MGVRSILGYLMAVLTIPLTLVTLVGGNFFAKNLLDFTGIKVSAWYTGGEVVETIDHGTYRTLLHRPVFDGLAYEQQEGFVQIDWEPQNSLPALITEDIDFDQDGDSDFRIVYDPAANRATISPYDARVIPAQNTSSTHFSIPLAGSFKLKDKNAVRVALYKKEK